MSVNMLADMSVGSDSLPYPLNVYEPCDWGLPLPPAFKQDLYKKYIVLLKLFIDPEV